MNLGFVILWHGRTLSLPFQNFRKDKDLSKCIWTVWIFVAQVLTFRIHIGILLVEFF